MSQHIEKTDSKKVYSGIFRHNQGYLVIFSHVEAYRETLRHIQAFFRRMEPFGTLRNPYINKRTLFRTLGYLEPKTSSNVCRTWDDHHIQSSDIEQLIQVFSTIFSHIEIYWFIQPHSLARNQEDEGRPPLLFLKTGKTVLILERKALIVSIFGLYFPFKSSFKSIWEKKTLKTGPLFLCFWQNYLSKCPSINPQPPSRALKSCWLRTCTQALFFFTKRSIIDVWRCSEYIPESITPQ